MYQEELWEESRATEMTIPFQDPAQGMVACEDDFETRFWRRKLDGIALDVSNKKCFPIEFKRTQDYRHTYEERAKSGREIGRVSNTRAFSEASKQLEAARGGRFSNWCLSGERAGQLGRTRTMKI